MDSSRYRLIASVFVATGFCAAVLFSAGCASVVNGRTQAVTVTSEPSGARVFIKSQLVGVTPARLELKRRDADIVLRLEKDGFSAQEIALKRSVSAWLLADAGVGLNPVSCQGLDSSQGCPAALAANLGTLVLIDFMTGAAYRHPGVVRAILLPLQPDAPRPKLQELRR
jgi:hypothetical protein